MEVQQFVEVLAALQKSEMKVSEEKRKAYASQSGKINDCLINFKKQAMIEDVSITEIWRTFFIKQVISVVNSINDSPLSPREYSEGMISRINDIRVYSAILAAMLVELGTARIENEVLIDT